MAYQMRQQRILALSILQTLLLSKAQQVYSTTFTQSKLPCDCVQTAWSLRPESGEHAPVSG
eukprot:6185480-Pleurochrysis_carterae.AAC.4